MAKLTKRLIEATEPGSKGVFLWDDTVRGFGLRVSPNGRCSFLVQYRLLDGRQRRRTLGTYPLLTVEQARKKASAWIVKAQEGDDPAESKDQERRAETVAELADRFLEEYAKVHKKKRSYEGDRLIVSKHIKPRLGSLKAVNVTRRDVSRLHQAMHATPYNANRVLACLSKMFNFAADDLRRVKSGWVNPCQGVRRYSEEQRKRYLSMLELAALGDALTHAQHEELCTPVAISAVRLLVFTGCRASEVFTLRWEHVDFERQVLHLADSKGGPRDVFLPAPALALLREMREGTKEAYVLPSPSVPDAPVQTIKKSWQHLREIASVFLWMRCEDPKVSEVVNELWTEREQLPDLEACQAALKEQLGEKYPLSPEMTDLRLHDLRHSFASVGAGAGLSLPIIGKLLGHQQVATTARYAHLAADPVQQAADLIGNRLSDAMGVNFSGINGDDPKKVVKLRKS
ncbi:tyrosine-type recombinase/integrase [Fodinicurvata sediminis]|uniref:tyrosine-type recombinase/integrase n=1 Tax=Fodinicurvata sediminis TaxID=1121832 RepID=UPI0003B4299A|nr:site-specific integrase [Fodinicurvata sediminis]